MRGSVLLHRQLSPEDLQQFLAWYKIRDTLLGQNCVDDDVKKALDLASVCEHPNAVWLTNLFGGRDISCREEARQVFLVVKAIQELFALVLVCLDIMRLKSVKRPSLAMRLPSVVGSENSR
jgi:hypothetical protein